MGKKNKKANGNEEIQAIMAEIKNAQPKEGAKVIIDTTQRDENGKTVETHQEQIVGEPETDVKTIEEMKAEYPDFNPDFENANNPEKDFGLSDDERKDIEELQKEYNTKHGIKNAPQSTNGGKVDKLPTKHKKPAKNAPKRIEDYEPKEIPDEAMQVYNLMLAGKSEPELRVMYADWSKRKFKAIMQRAKSLIAVAIQDKESAKADVLAKFQHLYNLAYKVGNIKECSRALENIAKINQLTTNLNISDSNFIALWGNQTNVNK